MRWHRFQRSKTVKDGSMIRATDKELNDSKEADEKIEQL